jgi:putative phosphoesterase
MRIAVISDIHGNRIAFDAVVADLREISPDLIFHGGDLADGGSSPAEIVDRVRDLGWPGVVGNGDQMLTSPETLEEFARSQPAALQPLFTMVREIAAATRAALSEERLAWLRELPRSRIHERMALVHASPASPWRSPTLEATDAELDSTYAPLGQPVVVYGHIHRPFIRRVSGMIVANTGSVSLSHDGDRRAAYLVLDDWEPRIRRVEYDVEQEIKDLTRSGVPHSEWIGRMLETGRFVMPG